MNDYIALADIIGRVDFLELACGRCERRGRLSIARLAREYAPETPVAIIMRAQIGDCPKQAARQERKRCDPYSPLAAVRRTLAASGTKHARGTKAPELLDRCYPSGPDNSAVTQPRCAFCEPTAIAVIPPLLFLVPHMDEGKDNADAYCHSN
jgi:hypothetical protein